MTKEQREIYKKIRDHLGKLHQKWETGLSNGTSDGHHKSDEGYVGILYRGDNWFEAECDYDKYVSGEPEIDMVEVYSYLFGPNRLHTFDSLGEAWEEVKKW
jgi:hypothetical protein